MLKTADTFQNNALDFKKALYDQKQDRVPTGPINSDKVKKIKQKIEAEQTMWGIDSKDLIPCNNCRKLCCGRHRYRDGNLCWPKKQVLNSNVVLQMIDKVFILVRSTVSEISQEKLEKEEAEQREQQWLIENQRKGLECDFDTRLSQMIKESDNNHGQQKEGQLSQFRSVASKFYQEGRKRSEKSNDSQFSYHQLIMDLKQITDKTDESVFEDDFDNGENDENNQKEEEAIKKGKELKEARKKDGFLEYGVSIENFFNLEWMLIKLFFWLTILSIPQLIVFAYNWSPSEIRQGNLLAQLSFGGLGQADNVCGQGNVYNRTDPITKELTQYVNIPLSCDQGYYISKVFNAWHVSVKAKQDETTHEQIEIDYEPLTHICEYRPETALSKTHLRFRQSILEQCGEQSSCNPKIKVTGLSTNIEVWNTDTIFYAITACTIIGGDEGEEMTTKREVGLFVAVIGLFMCIFFSSTITSMQNELHFEEKMLDQELVSVDDYTITGSLPTDLYQRILRQTEFVQAATRDNLESEDFQDSKVLKPIKRFEAYLKEVIIANLKSQMRKKAKQDKKRNARKEQDALKESHQSEKCNIKEQTRIVEIAFAFENRPMLRYLIALNKELAALSSVFPGCCSRLLTRRGLRQKIVAQKSLLAKSLNDEEKEEQMKANHKGCKIWCRAHFCGLREDFDKIVKKYVDQEFENYLVSLGSLRQSQLKDLLERFFLIYDINIELDEDEQKFKQLREKIDKDGDKKFQKAEIVDFIKETISSFTSSFANMDSIEENMSLQKEKDFLKMTKPKHFWVTFMEGESAQQLDELKRIDLNKHPDQHLKIKRKIKIGRAKSPSDIIWKNVGYPKWKLILWIIITGLIVLLVGCCAQMLFAAEISLQMYINYRVLPPGVNCDKLLSNMNENDQEFMSAIELLRIIEGKEHDPGVSGLSSRISKLGILPCFCHKEHLSGQPSDKVYKIRQLQDKEMVLCENQMKFERMIGEGQSVYYALSLAIIIQSYIFRWSFGLLAKKIRMGTHSNRLSFMVISTFIIFFINYGLAYALGPIRAHIPYTNKLSLDISVYYDFNQDWFTDIGELVVVTAFINALMPFVEDIMGSVMMNCICKRCDKKKNPCCMRICKCCSRKPNDSKDELYRTRQKTLFDYQDLHSGPEFEIHYKYAYMLTVTWVTFLFAPGMPILFPIALMGLMIMYTTNQYLLAKQCRKPPVYDETMTKVTLKTLKFAPYLYAIMGAWLYSNQQTFYNQVTYNLPYQLMMYSNHHIYQFWQEVTPGSVFFVYLLIAPIWVVLKWINKSMFGNCCCKNLWRQNNQPESELSYLDVERLEDQIKDAKSCDEFRQRFRQMMSWCRERSGVKKNDFSQHGLPSFYATLNDHERNSLICEEVENYSRLQIKTLTLENLLYLIFMPKVSNSSLELKGQSSYRMLRQPIAKKFNYISQPGFKLTPEDFVVSPYGNRPEDDKSAVDQNTKDDRRDSFVQDYDEEQDEEGKGVEMNPKNGTESKDKQEKDEKSDDHEINELKRCQLDVVRATANLAYIPPKLALRIRFNPGFIKLYNETNNDQKVDYEALTDLVKKGAANEKKDKIKTL